jgi:hypothetical protein
VVSSNERGGLSCYKGDMSWGALHQKTTNSDSPPPLLKEERLVGSDIGCGL